MDENQWHIPDGWTEDSLGSILDYEQPYKYTVDSTEYDGRSGIPVLTAGKSFILGYTTEQHNVYKKTPVVIFDDFTTDSKFVDFPFKVKSSAMKFLKPKKPDEFDIRIIFGHLQNLKIREAGGDHKRRWISEFSKLKVILPPFTEQTQIATILLKVDEAIAQTEQLIAKYTRIKTGLMQDLLTKGIDEHGNIRSEETHEFKDSPLGRIPKEWDAKRLDQMTKPNSPIVYGILMPGKHFFGGIPVVKVKDIFDEEIHLEELLYTNPMIANTFKRSELKRGDLLFTIRGTVGRCAFVQKELEGANITQDTARIRVKDEYRAYVRYAFETLDSKSYIQLNTIGQAVKGINLKALRELLILVPPPVEAQIIAKELDTANKFLSVESLKLSKIQSLKAGLIQDLLSGKVRVNHLRIELVSA